MKKKIESVIAKMRFVIGGVTVLSDVRPTYYRPRNLHLAAGEILEAFSETDYSVILSR